MGTPPDLPCSKYRVEISARSVAFSTGPEWILAAERFGTPAELPADELPQPYARLLLPAS
jgi:hypothetical protein